MNRRFCLLILSIAMIATVALAPAAAAGTTAPCTLATFAALNLPETTITLVESLPAGPNSAPVGKIAFPICRVRGVIAPANLFEVWMPTADWNGKFQGVGNGGLAGSISFGDMRTALSRNYATASTDTGHSSNAPDDPWWTNAQQIKDYGYRSIHELTVKAKAIINSFYGADPDRSYFVACSTGGRQGFMEAQRYPADYDGIIAGAPVYRVIELRARHVWTWQCNHSDPTGARAIPASKLPAIFKAVVAACDHLDGLVDGQVDDPRRCRFNPKSLLCTDADNDNVPHRTPDRDPQMYVCRAGEPEDAKTGLSGSAGDE